MAGQKAYLDKNKKSIVAIRLVNPEVRKKIRQSGATQHNVMDMLLGTDIGLSPFSWKENIKHIVTDKGNRLQNVATLLASASGFKTINYFNQLLAASTLHINHLKTHIIFLLQKEEQA